MNAPRPSGGASPTGYGHGAYDGFYAILNERQDTSATGTQVLAGAILRGELPPMPDPVEPPAE